MIGMSDTSVLGLAQYEKTLVGNLQPFVLQPSAKLQKQQNLIFFMSPPTSG